MTDTLDNTCWDVAIIGAGPTGLAAATELRKAGVERVLVLDREPEAGGIPRHCGHPPFGVKEFKRILTGPAYARRIAAVAQQAGVEFAAKTTVTSLAAGGRLGFVSPAGSGQLEAERVLLATGTRETPRSARMISGDRPLGICNTGALQSMVYLKNLVPFHRPVVVGTEIVSFSALLTCRKAGITPAAMLEQNSRPTVRWPIYHAARLFGARLFTGTKIIRILGRDRVTAVQIQDNAGNEQEIGCDGVLFTGLFTPESSLVRMSHLQLDPETSSPLVDQFGRCSDPSYYAAGNLLNQPVQVAGKCWNRGRLAALQIAQDLST